MPRTGLLARSVLVSSGALCDCHSRLILKVGGGHISLTDGRENLVGTLCKVVNCCPAWSVFPPTVCTILFVDENVLGGVKGTAASLCCHSLRRFLSG